MAKIALTEHEYLAFVSEYDGDDQMQASKQVAKSLNTTPSRAQQLIKGYQRKMQRTAIKDIFNIKDRLEVEKIDYIALDLKKSGLLLEGCKIISKKLTVIFDPLPYKTIRADLLFLINKDDIYEFNHLTRNKHFITREKLSSNHPSKIELQCEFYLSLENTKQIKILVTYWGGDLNLGREMIGGF